MSSTTTATTTAAMTTNAITVTATYTGRGCNRVPQRAQPKMPGKLLLCRARSEDFRRKLLKRFVVDDDLCFNRQWEVAEDCLMLNLPWEILGLVFRAVAHAPSQIALALSCKRMAAVARDLDLRLSITSPKYAGFLPREVFDVPALMKQLKPWMPPTLRLCDHCLTNRPASKEYWLDVDGCEISHFWITKTGWTFADASWHKQVHNICPACHINCSLSDYVDCDGCRALGRLGDVDWSRISDNRLRRTPEEMEANHWDLSG